MNKNESQRVYLKSLLKNSTDVVIFLSHDERIDEISPQLEAYYSWNLTEMKGDEISPQLEAYYSWNLTEMKGMEFPSLFVQKERVTPFSFSDYKTMREEGTSIETIVHHHRHKIYLSWTAIALTDDFGWLLLGRDVSDKKSNETHHRTLYSQLEQISAGVPGNFYWKNTEAQYLGCNKTLLKTLGLTSIKDIIGKTDKDLWPEQAEILKQNDQRVIQTGETLFLEEKVTMHGQEARYFTVIKMPLLDEKGTIIGILGNSLDITELKNTQAALQIAIDKAEAANLAKTEFIANMSHDIRTPLTGVIGLSELLEHTLQNDTDREKAHLLHDSGAELLHMLNEILDDVRVGNLRETDIKIESFDVHQCIHELIRLELPTTTVKHLELKADIAPDVPRYLRSDRNKIHRILLNLLGNAIKFTQTGSITLAIECLHKDSTKSHLKFSVSDTGIGIPEEAQTQVFNRFFKVSSSYKGVYTGHGLGLHIVQSYVTLLGGHITLTSKEGQGSTFNFDLECALGDFPATKSPSIQSQKPIGEKPQSALHLLLVEDNAIALKTLEFILSQKRYTFHSATTGEEAITLFQEHSFDLIITDIGLPGISGSEFSQRIRSQSTIPIIALTGHVSKEAKEEYNTCGIDEVLSKPAQIEVLHEYIQKLSQQSEQPLKNELSNSQQKSSLGLDLPDTEDELFQLGQFPFFDEELALKQLADKPLLISLLHSYISEMQQDINQLKEHYKNKDWEDVEKTAHKIKGGVVYLGTQRMRFACQYFERYYKAGHRTLLEPLYQQIINVNEETMTYIEDWLQKNKS
ncbi:MAG: ATP-binding protein [Legionella sp.]|uniref:ATP-binding protein n=1 Tax=Legionella sp. TaxID=459 RepID=UPI0039E49441